MLLLHKAFKNLNTTKFTLKVGRNNELSHLLCRIADTKISVLDLYLIEEIFCHDMAFFMKL